MAKRISITMTTCKRCGKPLATASRSLMGLDSLKEQYDRICSNCITKEEERIILDAQLKAIQGM